MVPLHLHRVHRTTGIPPGESTAPRISLRSIRATATGYLLLHSPQHVPTCIMCLADRVEFDDDGVVETHLRALQERV